MDYIIFDYLGNFEFSITDGARLADPRAWGVTSCSPSASQVYYQVKWVSSEPRADSLYLLSSFTPELQASQLSK